MSDDPNEVPNEDEEYKVMEAATDRVLTTLMEHFDSVYIFASKYDPQIGMTKSVHRGKGNYYTSSGLIREWLKKQDKIAELEVQKIWIEENDPPSED